MNRESKMHITPDSKVGALLEYYPELEEVLMAMSPSFKKLRNPVLRRTVAKVATLRQVAKIGNIPLSNMINDLRKAVGHASDYSIDSDDSISEPMPTWFDRDKVTTSFDARPVIEAGRNPMGEFFKILDEADDSGIVELITPFVPAPLIEIARGKNYLVWTEQIADDKFQTYFHRDLAEEGN
ncbi:MAG: DUF1858 domain-containing protein [Candidatus Zixiibacteriota bacterium]